MKIQTDRHTRNAEKFKIMIGHLICFGEIRYKDPLYDLSTSLMCKRADILRKLDNDDDMGALLRDINKAFDNKFNDLWIQTGALPVLASESKPQ